MGPAALPPLSDPAWLPFGMLKASRIFADSARSLDGSTSEHPAIGVHTVTIGRYVLHNVQMVVNDDGATLLLGLPVLNTIGSFTVDQSRHQIRFN